MSGVGVVAELGALIVATAQPTGKQPGGAALAIFETWREERQKHFQYAVTPRDVVLIIEASAAAIQAEREARQQAEQRAAAAEREAADIRARHREGLELMNRDTLIGAARAICWACETGEQPLVERKETFMHRVNDYMWWTCPAANIHRLLAAHKLT